MAVPTTRAEFKSFCLRKLGAPVIQVNVSDDQIDDRVDEALKFYADYHFDGSNKIYYKHQLQAADVANKYITLPENIIGTVQIFPVADPSIRSDDMFNIRYQIALNDLYSLTSTSLVPYYMVREHLALISEILVGRQPIRYQRHRNRLDIDMNWDNVKAGDFLLVEAYEVIDPNEYTDVWGDRWLANYCSVLLQMQWANNLMKYKNVPLPGGVMFNAEDIMRRAETDKKNLEEEMINSYSIPPQDFYG